jgi:hypothetical protein
MGYKIKNLKVDGVVYELPTKTSDLENDKEFQTKNEVEELVGNIQTGVSIVNQTETTLEIQPNCLNVWGEVAELTITLATPTDTSIVNEYMVQFTSGATASTLVLPDTIQWLSEPTINPNATYQLSIVNNLAVIGEFSNE